MCKILVAYFSCSGVTETLAKLLASMVDGDTYKIEPAVPYTDADLNWRDQNARSTIEMRDKKSRPAIAEKVQSMDDYNVVYVGFPIWWYIAHMRLLRDKQPVKCRQPFSLRVGAQGCNAVYIFKQIREGDCLQEYMRYYGQHKPLLAPQRPLFILSAFLHRGKNALC